MSCLFFLPAAISPRGSVQRTITFNDFPPHSAAHGESHAPETAQCPASPRLNLPQLAAVMSPPPRPHRLHSTDIC